jgi:hypothetical protein
MKLRSAIPDLGLNFGFCDISEFAEDLVKSPMHFETKSVSYKFKSATSLATEKVRDSAAHVN